jgi:hypothetical protein
MGAEWVTVREAIAAGTLRATDRGLPAVVSRWEQLLRYAALRLGRELGADVQVVLTRKELAEPASRFAAQAQSLVTGGVLIGTIRIPDAVAPLDVTADLRAGRITVSADIDAPRDGRATTRVNWLTRQLRDAPDGLRVDAFAMNKRTSTSELLRIVRESPGVLIEDAKRDIRMFRVAASSPAGTKRGTGRGAFIDSVLASIDGFYELVLQQVRPWAPRAPQLPGGGRTATEEAGIDTTPPPGDLDDLGSIDDLGQAPPDEPAIDIVADAVTEVAGDAGAGTLHEPSIGLHGVGELMTWDVAQARLDEERTVSFSDADRTGERPDSDAAVTPAARTDEDDPLATGARPQA